MSIIPPGEKIVETKTCLISGEEFHVTDKDLEFYDKVSPIFNGKKYTIPSPNLSEKVRMQGLMAFRNEQTLYQGTCVFSGKKMITMYGPHTGMTVYLKDNWYSDDWSAFDHAQSIDFSRPFFDQLTELYKKVPVANLYQSGGNLENCDYVNWFGMMGEKNCYYCFNGGGLEDCMYTRGTVRSQDCYDVYYSSDSDNCYEVTNCMQCTNLLFSESCSNCQDSLFLDSCIGCHHCFGCVNLSGASYCMFNESLGEAEYTRRMKEMNLSHNVIHKVYEKLKGLQASLPIRYLRVIKSEQSVGDLITACSHVIGGYECQECEHGKNIESIKFASHTQDCLGFGYNGSYMLGCIGSGEGSVFAHTIGIEGGNNVYYSTWSNYCSDIIGCCSLRHAQNCIFNTAYSVQEYEKLAVQLIDHMRSTGEWGRPLPPSMSPFGYDETVGNDFYPLSEQEVKSRGWNWVGNNDTQFSKESYTPLDIGSYDESVVGVDVAKNNIQQCLMGVVKCSETGKGFKIQSRELAFYIDHKLPLPTLHPNVRYRHRVERLDSRKLYERTCMCPTCKSPNEPMYTTYAPDRPETVYCETCYREEVYS